jgi:hypothetical protein
MRKRGVISDIHITGCSTPPGLDSFVPYPRLCRGLFILNPSGVSGKRGTEYEIKRNGI